MTISTTPQTSLERVGIITANHTGYVNAMFSCMETGVIAVPLGNAEDHYRIKAAKVEKIITPEQGEKWMACTFKPQSSDELALITFTSGTEGNPKGVMLTHNNLADVITRLNNLMQVDDSISEYIGVPVYHSFGLGRCRAVASTGGRFFIPDHFSPSEIGDMLKKGIINAISAVPSLWRILLANKDSIGHYGKRVQWIEIGSQYMSKAEKEALKLLFPKARIIQHYGLTEASRTTLLEIHQEEGEKLESVGLALGEVEVKLTAEQHIAILGPHVAAGYIIDGQETNLKDEAGWFVTKDLGKIDDGYLYYQGRADDIINCGGIKISPEALETKLYTKLQIESGLAVCRKPDPMRGEGFLVAIEVNIDKKQLHETVLTATLELGVNAANAISIVEVESLPKTASGKIQRRKLTEWYTSQESVAQPASDIEPATPIQQVFDQTLRIRNFQPEYTFISLGGDSFVAPRNHLEIQLTKIWESVLGIKPIGIHDNFFNIGGYSLLAMTLVARIEKTFGKLLPVMTIFQSPTIAQLAYILREESEGTISIRALQAIQPIGSRPPFFFIGSTNYARALAPLLGNDQPVYGLNIFGLQPKDGTILELDVKDIARQYIQEIQTVQQTGPYYLCGYCDDAKVAFEMAQQLQVKAQEVAFLGFIDAIWKAPTTTPQTTTASSSKNRYARFWHNLLKGGPSYLIYKILEKLNFWKRRNLPIAWAIINKKLYKMMGKTLPLKLQHTLLVKQFIKTLKNYAPQPYSGHITFFVSYEWRTKPFTELTKLVGERMAVYEVPGYHSNLFEEPQISALGENIKLFLEKAQKQAQN